MADRKYTETLPGPFPDFSDGARERGLILMRVWCSCKMNDDIIRLNLYNQTLPLSLGLELAHMML